MRHLRVFFLVVCLELFEQGVKNSTGGHAKNIKYSLCSGQCVLRCYGILFKTGRDRVQLKTLRICLLPAWFVLERSCTAT